MENNIQYRMYRSCRADGTPWKDWLIAETPDGRLEVWFGACGEPLRHLDVSKTRGMDKRIAEQERDGYVYLGQAEIVDRQPQLLGAAQPAPPENETETDDARLYWELAEAPRLGLLHKVRALCADLPEWVTAVHDVSPDCVEIESKAHAPWRFDLTPDGMHNTGHVPEACGPAPVLVLLKLARDGDMQLSGKKGEDIDPARFNACRQLLLGDAPQAAVDDAAARLGLALPSLSSMRIKRRDAWL